MKKIMILSVATATILALSACGSNENKEAANKAAETTHEVAKKATETTASAAEATKEAAAKTVEAAKETATKAAEATKEAAAKATEKVKEAAAKTAEAAKETATKAVEAAKEAVGAGSDKGKAVYAKCVSCHGADGKTKALGKSAPIAGWDVAKTEEALNGYKAGTRNVHGMGALMKGQVASLSDEDIKAVAEYIASLK